MSTFAQRKASSLAKQGNTKALASMNKSRASNGLSALTGSESTSESTRIDKATNSVVGVTSGKVLAVGTSLADALAKQNQVSSGSTPSVSGRPDLYGTTPLASEGQKYFDESTKTTVTPTTATPEQLKQVELGTLDSFNKAQGLTYLDGATFKTLQPNLNETDLIRGPNGQIWLKKGLTPEQVNARGTTSVTGTSTGVNGMTGTGDFKVDDSAMLSTDSVSELLDVPVTDTDFNTMMAEIKAQQDELLTLMVPGADEQATKAEILDIKDQVEKSLVELSMGLNNVEDQPIAMQFITGQQASIQRSAEAKLQNLARIETNLLNELGLEQEARQVEASVAQTKLGYLQTNLDTAFKVKAMIQADEDRIFARSQALSTSAQNTLSMVLDSMQGISEEDMTMEQQKQLQDLAISAGIPYSLLTAGLDNVKKQLSLEAVSAGLPGSIYTSEQLTFINQISDDMRTDQNIKDFTPIKSGYQRVQDGANLDSGPGDLAVIFGYMKMLDPTSVVREGEFATAENSSGIPEYIRAQYNRLTTGTGERLTDVTKQGFVDASESLYETALNNYQNSYNYYANRATTAGLNPDDVLFDASSISTTKDATTFIPITQSYNSVSSLLDDNPTIRPAIDSLKASGYQEDEILQFIEQNGGLSFSYVGADTNQGTKIMNQVMAFNDGDKGGQCGHFVNQIAGTHMRDSYASKAAYVNIARNQQPSAGDIFVMPYKSTGHTGFVIGSTKLSDGTYDVLVQDSNWGLNEKVQTHTINSSKLSGYARIS